MENLSKPSKLRVAKTTLPDYQPEFNELMRLHQEALKALYHKLKKEMPQSIVDSMALTQKKNTPTI